MILEFVGFVVIGLILLALIFIPMFCVASIAALFNRGLLINLAKNTFWFIVNVLIVLIGMGTLLFILFQLSPVFAAIRIAIVGK